MTRRAGSVHELARAGGAVPEGAEPDSAMVDIVWKMGDPDGGDTGQPRLVPPSSHDGLGTENARVSVSECGQLARIGSWTGQVTRSSEMGIPCMSKGWPHSQHRPGGAVDSSHAFVLRLHAAHSLTMDTFLLKSAGLTHVDAFVSEP